MSYYNKIKTLNSILKYGIKDAIYSNNKINAKKLARSIDIRVPEDIDLQSSFIIKSKLGDISVKGNVVRYNRRTGLIEELISSYDDFVPPTSFKIYTFNNKAEIIKVIKEFGEEKVLYQYTTELKRIKNFTNCSEGEDEIDFSGVDIDYILKKSEELSHNFYFPVRCDWFISKDGPVFNEFTINPSLRRKSYIAMDILTPLWKNHFKGIENDREFTNEDIYRDKEVFRRNRREILKAIKIAKYEFCP